MSKQKNIKLYNLKKHNNALKEWFFLYKISVILHDYVGKYIGKSKRSLSMIKIKSLIAKTEEEKNAIEFERLYDLSEIDIAKSRDKIENVVRCLIGSLDDLPHHIEYKQRVNYTWRRALEVIYWTGFKNAYNVPISESIACLYDPGAKTEEGCLKFVSQVESMNKKLDTLSKIKDIQAIAEKISKAEKEFYEAFLKNREKIYKK